MLFSAAVGEQPSPVDLVDPGYYAEQADAVRGNAQSLQTSASRGEFADFQVHALPGANAIRIDVAVSDFTNSQTGYVVLGASNVFLYGEAYPDIK